MNYGLFKRSHSQHVHLFLSEVAPIATTEVLLGEASEEDAIKLNDMVAKVLEDATHDTVATAVDLDAHLLLVCLACILDGVGMYLAVLKVNSLRNLLNVSGCDVLVEVYVIDLLLKILGMCQFAGQIAIVG